VEFIKKAASIETGYRMHKKQLILEIAIRLEDELKTMGRDDLIPHICQEITKILKWVRIPWSEKVVRNCLPQHYKIAYRRENALARQRYPGVPEDSGKTAEELEASLNGQHDKKKGPAGNYTVKCHMPVDGNEPLNTLCMKHENGEIHAFLPVIVQVKASEQDATVELDKEEYNAFMGSIKPKPKPKPTSNKKSKKVMANAEEKMEIAERLATRALDL
jgi:hypothetical protein